MLSHGANGDGSINQLRAYLIVLVAASASAHLHALLWLQLHHRHMSSGVHPYPRRCLGALGVLGGWGVFVSSLSLTISTPNSITLRDPYIIFVPPGHPFHSGGFGAPWQLDPPAHSLAIPSEDYLHPGGLVPPLFLFDYGGIIILFLPPAYTSPPLSFFCTMSPLLSCVVCVYGIRLQSVSDTGSF